MVHTHRFGKQITDIAYGFNRNGISTGRETAANAGDMDIQASAFRWVIRNTHGCIQLLSGYWLSSQGYQPVQYIPLGLRQLMLFTVGRDQQPFGCLKLPGSLYYFFNAAVSLTALHHRKQLPDINRLGQVVVRTRG